MTSVEVFEMIESPAFAAQLTVASDLKTFLRAARRQGAVERLTIEAGKSRGNQLCNRIMNISAKNFNDDLQNPLDVAIAIYLWVLSSIDEELGRSVAVMFANASRAWWWARQMAAEILQVRTKQVSSRMVFLDNLPDVDEPSGATTISSIDVKISGGNRFDISHVRREAELLVRELRV